MSKKLIIQFPNRALLENPDSESLTVRKWVKERLNLLNQGNCDREERVNVSEGMGIASIVLGVAAFYSSAATLGTAAMAIGGISTLLTMIADASHTRKMKFFSWSFSEVKGSIRDLQNNALPEATSQTYTKEQLMSGNYNRQISLRNNTSPTADKTRTSESKGKFLTPLEACELRFVESSVREVILFLEKRVPPQHRWDTYLEMCQSVYDDQLDSPYFDMLDEVARAFPVIQTIDVPGAVPQMGHLPMAQQYLNNYGTPQQTQGYNQPQYQTNGHQYQQPECKEEQHYGNKEEDEVVIQTHSYQRPGSQIKSGYDDFLENIDKSCCVVGQQRSGKSRMVALASRQKAAEGYRVYMVNLAAKKIDQDGRWDHCYWKVEVDIGLLRTDPAQEAVDEARDLIEDYLHYEGRKILIVDEWMSVASKANKHRKILIPFVEDCNQVVNVAISTGIGQGICVVFICPYFAAKGLQDNATIVSQLRLIMTFINKGEEIPDQNGNPLTYQSGIAKGIQRNFPDQYVELPDGVPSANKRVYCADEVWRELGDESNYKKVNVKTVSDKSKTNQNVKKNGLVNLLNGTPEEVLQEAISRAYRTDHRKLWDFVENDLGFTEHEDIKCVIDVLAKWMESNDNTLGRKFIIGSPFKAIDARYSYSGYKEKRDETVALNNGICCVCQINRAEQAHHLNYDGKKDEPKKNMVPVCKKCHYDVCHSALNWEQDFTSIWNSHSTSSFAQRIVSEMIL
ncbi:MAG: hypothetical protein F6J98_02205 [Moorea sp. SIO4G2]|nr:hypothetical protein [Moorena sp. SIO4G2]